MGLNLNKVDQALPWWKDATSTLRDPGFWAGPRSPASQPPIPATDQQSHALAMLFPVHSRGHTHARESHLDHRDVHEQRRALLPRKIQLVPLPTGDLLVLEPLFYNPAHLWRVHGIYHQLVHGGKEDLLSAPVEAEQPRGELAATQARN